MNDIDMLGILNFIILSQSVVIGILYHSRRKSLVKYSTAN